MFVGMIASEFNAPFARIEAPEWLVPLAGIAFLGYLLIAVVVAAALWGWLDISASPPDSGLPPICYGSSLVHS